MVTYKELFPLWDPEKFRLPGMSITGAELGTSAYRASRKTVQKGGSSCPCCGQHIQVYSRSIYKKMAKCLIWLVAEYKGDWISLKDGPIFLGGDNAKLLYWHLVTTETSNLYKPTEVAVAFVNRTLTLPKYAYVFDGNVLGYSKERTSIEDCLDHDFDLSDIGVAPWTKYG